MNRLFAALGLTSRHASVVVVRWSVGQNPVA
jgi:hypothetical protein